MKSLGAGLRFRRGLKNEHGEKRITRGLQIAKRIEWAPLPMHVRAQLLASMVCPLSLYSICAAPVPQLLLENLSSACMAAVWGSTRKLRCKEVVMTLLVQGHRVDPLMAASYQCLVTLRRQLRKKPDLMPAVQRTWRLYEAGTAHAPGPVGFLQKVLTELDWNWNAPDSFSRPGQPPLPITGGTEGWWQHQVRDGLRFAYWKRAGQRREDMAGLDCPFGVDRLATLAVYNSKETSPQDAGILRSILSGSLRFQERLHIAGLADDATCPFCQLEPETVEHCFWVCPCWDHVRRQHAIPGHHVTDAWPACTRQCGLFLGHEAAFQANGALENEQHAVPLAAIAAAEQQRLDAIAVHSMMLEIVKARRQQEVALRRLPLDEAEVPEHELAALDADPDSVVGRISHDGLLRFPSEADPG